MPEKLFAGWLIEVLLQTAAMARGAA